MIKHFEAAWKQIEERYKSGRICSERHLQAEIFHILYSNSEFLKNYELRVEPCLYESNKITNESSLFGVIPDMLVVSVNEREIVAHVELKYIPHGFVTYEKDIANMVKLWRLKGRTDINFFLTTLPQSGDWNYDYPYTISQGFQLIYGLIGNEESYCIQNREDIWKTERTGLSEIPKYIQLIGSISKDKEPKFM